MSSIPRSVGYIFHVHRAYDYLGSFGVLWVHMAMTQKLCLKKKKKKNCMQMHDVVSPNTLAVHNGDRSSLGLAQVVCLVFKKFDGCMHECVCCVRSPADKRLDISSISLEELKISLFQNFVKLIACIHARNCLN